MSNNANMYGVPPQTVQALPAGATNIRNAAIVNQNNATAKQMALIGGKKKRIYKGGASTITVPPVPSTGISDGGASANNYKMLTEATANQTVQAGYDACVGQGASCTAQVYATQKQMGGRKKKQTKKGGSHKWSCMSGGKKRLSRKNKKQKKSCRKM